jgi:hypothetical protein
MSSREKQRDWEIWERRGIESINAGIRNPVVQNMAITALVMMMALP